MSRGLVVVVPSRGRPQAVAEIAAAFRETCTRGTRLAFALDEGDGTHSAYMEEIFALQDTTTHITWENRSMVEALNFAAVGIATQSVGPFVPPFAIGFMGDDHRPRTKGWDDRYVDELAKLGTGIVYGDDKVQGHRLPTQCAMTSDIIRTLGYMAPPDLTHMYVDNAWLALGRAIGRITYLPDVIVEHLHPVAGTAEMDDGYRRVNAPEVYARDKAVYERWLTESLPAEAHRIRKAAIR